MATLTESRVTGQGLAYVLPAKESTQGDAGPSSLSSTRSVPKAVSGKREPAPWRRGGTAEGDRG